MSSFSKRSKENLSQCDIRLQKIFNEVILITDCAVICGHRGEEEQNKAYNEGKSKLKYPQSKHNKIPSQAVDVVPFPIDWSNIERFKELASKVKQIAEDLDIKIECGCDWKWKDFPHFQVD